ncbi:hypothetical protein HNY73_017673 [Argiope bruennichi]|uniref:Uncharacterized protein n=1 Tax=Argiope bruennichi TaxID=94029 RepID=A0A8T0EBU0_ARGBR|nr:hypothetical protein HNY73_017673 [Argiope bruennichi]
MRLIFRAVISNENHLIRQSNLRERISSKLILHLLDTAVIQVVSAIEVATLQSPALTAFVCLPKICIRFDCISVPFKEFTFHLTDYICVPFKEFTFDLTDYICVPFKEFTFDLTDYICVPFKEFTFD